MYGWRTRIGLVIPANNTVIEPEFAQMVPNGVAAFAAKIRSHGLSTEGIDRMVSHSHRAIEELAVGNIDVFGYACLATSLIKGSGWTSEFEKWVEDTTGKRAVTAASASIAALQALKISRVALATPYPSSVNDLLPALLSTGGIEIVSCKSVTVKDSLEVCRLEPSVAYQLAQEADTEHAEAVCILATDFRSVDVLAALEADLGKPILSTNQALLWSCLAAGEVKEIIMGYGSLLGIPASDDV